MTGRTTAFFHNSALTIMTSNLHSPQTAPRRIARTAARVALAAVTLLFGACSALVFHPKPAPSWTQRSGQVKFSSAKVNFVGDIVIRHDDRNFVAEISKGPGVPLLKLSAKFGADPKLKALPENHMLVVKATGPLSRGGWTWNPKSLTTTRILFPPNMKPAARAWAALPEVFQWGNEQAKGADFRVCLPDITMHAKAGHGRVQRFDYSRHENSTGNALPLNDLRKMPVLETVACQLDK